MMRSQFAAMGVLLAAVGCAGNESAFQPAVKSAPEEKSKAAARTHHDVHPPAISEHMRTPAMLVFTKTAGYRHNEGIAGAAAFFARLAREAGEGFFLTENGAVFNRRDLQRFDLVIFNNVSGDALNAAQEAALKDWFEAGGGLISLHGSGTARPADWDWYADAIIGPQFTNHPADPQFQDARVVNLAPGHPIMAGLPADWTAHDEWYSFDSRAQNHGMRPLYGLDERTYAPVNHRYGAYSDLRMGDGAINHPIAWVACQGAGRAFYPATGHYDTAYTDENLKTILANAARWVRKRSDPDARGCPAG